MSLICSKLTMNVLRPFLLCSRGGSKVFGSAVSVNKTSFIGRGKYNRYLSRSSNLSAPTTKWPKLPELHFDVPHGKAMITVPGMCRATIDRAGVPFIWEAATYTEIGRMTFYSHPPFDSLIDNRLMFMMTANYKYEPAFYTSSSKNQPITIDTQIVNLKNTSFAHNDRIIGATTGETLWTAHIQLVTVNKETRRPLPLPQQVKDAIGDRGVSLPMERIAKLDRPSNTHVHQYQVQWSDADNYFHTNHSSYLRFCHDAATVFSRQGQFSRLKGDLAYQTMETCKCNYLGETKPGDIVDIHVWEDAEDPLKLNFELVKNNVAAFQCSMTFLTPVGSVM